MRTRVILVERAGYKKKVKLEPELCQSLEQLQAFLAPDAHRAGLKWEYFDSNDFHELIDLDEDSFADAVSIERLKVRITGPQIPVFPGIIRPKPFQVSKWIGIP